MIYWEAHISDKSRSGRVVALVNTGRTVSHPNGGRVNGYASGSKMFVASEGAKYILRRPKNWNETFRKHPEVKITITDK